MSRRRSSPPDRAAHLRAYHEQTRDYALALKDEADRQACALHLADLQTYASPPANLNIPTLFCSQKHVEITLP